MTVDKNTDFDNLLGTVTEVNNAVVSLGTTYKGNVQTIQTSLGAITFSGWEDDISSKLQANASEAKSMSTSISNDLSSGGYNTLKTKLKELVNEVNNAINKKAAIAAAEEAKSKLPAKVGTGEYTYTQNADWRGSAYGGSGNYYTKTEIMKDNPAIAEKEQEITKLKGELDTIVGKIQLILALLPNIQFGGSSDGADTASQSGGNIESQAPAANSSVKEAAGAKDQWQVETVWTTKDDHAKYYFYITSDGKKVSIDADPNGNPVVYSYVEGGEVHWFDSNFNEISLDQRNTIMNQYHY